MLTFIREAFEKQFGKITPAKILVGLAVIFIVVRVLGFILGLFDALLPFVVLGVLGYFAYQALESRAPDWRDKVKNAVDNATARRDTAAEDAVKKATRNAEAVLKRESPIDTVVKQTVNRATGVEAVKQEAPSSTTERLEDAPTVVEEVTETETEPAARLMVEPKTNPETGLQETDMERLMEKEEEMLKAPQTSADAVRAQLEERRRRLKSGDE